MSSQHTHAPSHAKHAPISHYVNPPNVRSDAVCPHWDHPKEKIGECCSWAEADKANGNDPVITQRDYDAWEYMKKECVKNPPTKGSWGGKDSVQDCIDRAEPRGPIGSCRFCGK